MVFGLGAFEQMELDKPGTRSKYESRLSHTFSKAPSAPLFTRKRFMAINIVFSRDYKGQIVVSYLMLFWLQRFSVLLENLEILFKDAQRSLGIKRIKARGS